MKSRLPSLKRSLLLSGLVALTVLSALASAQDPNASTPQSTNKQASTPAAQQSSAAKTSSTPTPPTATNTNTNTKSSSSSTGTPPKITDTATNTAVVTGLPKLTNTPIVNSYPPPSVPPTADAPFMQHSSLPDGTVFIAVGAILGAFGVAIIVWRGIVACLLHRSVERAAQAQHDANDKASFPAPPAPFYKYTDRDSSPSLAVGGASASASAAAAAAAGRGVRRTNRGPTPSATPSQTNLFFSPTAASGVSGGGGSTVGRDSRFLPSGFYASANSAGSPSPNPAQMAGHGHSISLSNLRPDSRGQYGALSRSAMRDPSPPDSPQFGGGGAPAPSPSPLPPQQRRDLNSSSLSINRPPSGRAPSAFLDDLLDENPHAFPPPQMPGQPGGGPRHSYNHSHSSLGRY